MANLACTSKELAAPRFNPDLLCITLDHHKSDKLNNPHQNLENQVSQLANTVGKLEAQNSHKFTNRPEKTSGRMQVSFL
ncbi:Serine--tRNA ligase [Bienertia sinuspersici]